MAEKGKGKQPNAGTQAPTAEGPDSDLALGLTRLYEEEDGDLVAFAPDGEAFTVFTEHRSHLPDFPG